MQVSDNTRRIVIVGAGCFGTSTAYHLLQRGYTDITVIDRSPILPAPDAASTDLNKVVRSSYADPFYTALAREAIDAWKNVEEWGDTYHESGVYCAMEGQESYIDQAYANDLAAGARLSMLQSPDAVRATFPAGINLALPDNARGFLNRDGGWASASEGVRRMLDKVGSLGGKIVHGRTAVELVRGRSDNDMEQVTAVRCTDGTVLNADLVILALGSWTASTFPGLGVDGQCLATGQSIAFVQLTPEEAELYRKCPVYLDFHSGFYVFPPNVDNIVKCGIHTGGLTRKVQVRVPTANPDSAGDGAGDGCRYISTPRTVTSDGADGLRIPRSAVQNLRAALALVYPDLASKPFSATRICWYTDSTNEDWVIGTHRDFRNVFLATSGSGHAYKFLPIIGRLVADAVEGKLSEDLVRRFAPDRVDQDVAVEPGVRADPPAELVMDELCTPEDLLPV